MSGILEIILGVSVTIYIFAALYWFVISSFETRPRADEHHLVQTADGWRIRVSRYRSAKGGGEPILLVHGVLENQFTFSSPPKASLIDTLTAAGYDCWHVELRGARSCRPPAGFSRYEANMDDYVLRDLPAIVEHILESTNRKQLHWIGHSMGGMVLYCYLLTHGDKQIATGTTLGSPPSFKGVKIPGAFLLRGLLRYAPRLADLALKNGSALFPVVKFPSVLAPINWRNMDPRVDHKTFFNLIEILPAGAAEDILSWAKSGWTINNGTINVDHGLATLKIPLLSIYGGIDRFIPLANGQEFHDNLASKDKRMLVLSKENGCQEDYSHVDLVFGKNGIKEVYEPILAWLQDHTFKATATKKKTATKKAATKSKTKPKAKAKPPAKKKAPAKKKPTTKKKTSTKKKASTKNKTVAKKTAVKKKAPRKKS